IEDHSAPIGRTCHHAMPLPVELYAVPGDQTPQIWGYLHISPWMAHYRRLDIAQHQLPISSSECVVGFLRVEEKLLVPSPDLLDRCTRDEERSTGRPVCSRPVPIVRGVAN